MYSMQTRMKKNEPAWITVLGLLVAVYIAHNHLPVVGYYMSAIIYLGIFSMIFFLLFMSSRSLMSTLTFFTLIAVFALDILDMLYMLVNGNLYDTAISIYGYLQTFLYGWIALWYIKYNNSKKIRRILRVIFGCYITTCITTIIGNNKYPGASRLLATTIETTDTAIYNKYVSENIGEFSFIYGIVLLTPLLVYLVKKRKINIIFATVVLAVIGFTVISSEYATALVLFVANLLLLFFRKPTTKKVLVIVVACLVFVFIAAPIISTIFDYLADNVSSRILSARFEYMATLLRGGETENIEGVGDRVVLYEKAINTIFETKFMGNWTGKGGSGHSMVLDTVVKYGVVGIAALTIMYSAIYKIAIAPHKNKEYGAYLSWIYLTGIVLAVVNTKPNLFVFIFVIPLFTNYVDNMDELEEKDHEISVDSK